MNHEIVAIPKVMTRRVKQNFRVKFWECRARVGKVWFGWVGFYGILTIGGYLIPNLV